jgi:hypothetical protein
LSDFYGSDPNGAWSLYIVDDHGRDEGQLAGWSLDFGPEWFRHREAYLSDVQMLYDGSFQMQLNGEPDKIYFIEASPDMQQWDLIQTRRLVGTSETITDTTAAERHYRFYRVSGCLY